ncbi:MAG: spore cortex biosynthesis protein YabQ [Eubacteriales bacterium]|nr:spore cortex biosynthesis protein YabQ [Eubacteriales bacterium]
MYSILTGIALLTAYDVLRLMRVLIRHRPFVVGIEDFLYWCAAAVVIFSVILEKNDGNLRGYAFAGIILGAWIQGIVLSFFRRIWIKILKNHRKRVKMTKSDFL